MNDSPVDIGIVDNPRNPLPPVVGEPIPIIGLVAFLDHTWNEKFTTSFGYSCQDNDNTDGQAPDAFKDGQYALGNLLYYAGAERDGRRRAAVGPARELLRRLRERRRQDPVLVQIQLLVEARRLVMTRRNRTVSIGACALALSALAALGSRARGAGAG